MAVRYDKLVNDMRDATAFYTNFGFHSAVLQPTTELDVTCTIDRSKIPPLFGDFLANFRVQSTSLFVSASKLPTLDLRHSKELARVFDWLGGNVSSCTRGYVNREIFSHILRMSSADMSRTVCGRSPRTRRRRLRTPSISRTDVQATSHSTSTVFTTGDKSDNGSSSAAVKRARRPRPTRARSMVKRPNGRAADTAVASTSTSSTSSTSSTLSTVSLLSTSVSACVMGKTATSSVSLPSESSFAKGDIDDNNDEPQIGRASCRERV